MKLHVSTDNTEYPIIINNNDELEVQGDIANERDEEERFITEEQHDY